MYTPIFAQQQPLTPEQEAATFFAIETDRIAKHTAEKKDPTIKQQRKTDVNASYTKRRLQFP